MIALVLFLVLSIASYLLFLAKTADVETLKQSMEARTEIIDKNGHKTTIDYLQSRYIINGDVLVCFEFQKNYSCVNNSSVLCHF